MIISLQLRYKVLIPKKNCEVPEKNETSSV